jgi:hypothetical protein
MHASGGEGNRQAQQSAEQVREAYGVGDSVVQRATKKIKHRLQVGHVQENISNLLLTTSQKGRKGSSRTRFEDLLP